MQPNATRIKNCVIQIYGIGHTASCEQSKLLALGKMLVRCQWQMQDKYFGAAVDKIEDQRKPDDFIGHRKPAAKPKMPLISNPVIRTIHRP